MLKRPQELSISTDCGSHLDQVTSARKDLTHSAMQGGTWNLSTDCQSSYLGLQGLLAPLRQYGEAPDCTPSTHPTPQPHQHQGTRAYLLQVENRSICNNISGFGFFVFWKYYLSDKMSAHMWCMCGFQFFVIIKLIYFKK